MGCEVDWTSTATTGYFYKYANGTVYTVPYKKFCSLIKTYMSQTNEYDAGEAGAKFTGLLVMLNFLSGRNYSTPGQTRRFDAFHDKFLKMKKAWHNIHMLFQQYVT